ncbi:MAG: hypothetical protein K2O67_04945 [Clostridia bacterium]|nr:hypothetical protein [Clostridia bacterium]
MKDNRTDNDLQVTAETAPAENETAAAGIGKFKDVQSLWNAYQALEAEFTRRSQKLKELEANKEVKAAEVAETAETPSQTAEDAGETQIKSPELSEEVKNAVISEYLNGIFQGRGVPFVTGGGAVAAQRHTPKTLKEAGALAGKLFDNKEEN